MAFTSNDLSCLTYYKNWDKISHQKHGWDIEQQFLQDMFNV